MFEKLPSDYRLTNTGEAVLDFAEQMEASSNQLETRVFGRDQRVRGLLRVTLPPRDTFAHARLCRVRRLHPEIEMEISSIDHPVDLANRQADVAIRVVYDCNALPQNLHGLNDPELFGGVYMSRDLLTRWRAGAPDLWPTYFDDSHRPRGFQSRGVTTAATNERAILTAPISSQYSLVGSEWPHRLQSQLAARRRLESQSDRSIRPFSDFRLCERSSERCARASRDGSRTAEPNES
jgi:DNA-binding transcriptional LysR family regulator